MAEAAAARMLPGLGGLSFESKEFLALFVSVGKILKRV